RRGVDQPVHRRLGGGRTDALPVADAVGGSCFLLVVRRLQESAHHGSDIPAWQEGEGRERADSAARALSRGGSRVARRIFFARGIARGQTGAIFICPLSGALMAQPPAPDTDKPTQVPPAREFRLPPRIGVFGEARLTLEQALSMALANNRDIEASKI